MKKFTCAQCGVQLETVSSANIFICPVCDFVNDVQERLMSEKIKTENVASVIKYEGCLLYTSDAADE